MISTGTPTHPLARIHKIARVNSEQRDVTGRFAGGGGRLFTSQCIYPLEVDVNRHHFAQSLEHFDAELLFPVLQELFRVLDQPD